MTTVATERDSTIPMFAPRETPLLMIIDGHALVHRSWHAISVRQQLSSSRTGEDTTAVFGFANTFLKALEEWAPTHCAIAFDLPTPTFRHIKFKAYKAQRPAMPPELRPQFDRIKQLMSSFNVPIFEAEGYEADDVIGTLAREAEEQRIETVILTGDTDTFQLVSPWVRVALHYSIQDRKVYDEAEIRVRYGGLEPSQQPDVKALKGDSSDNIPGVPGIGDKTAVKLVVEHGSIEGLYEHIEKVTPPRIREALISSKDLALQGKELTTIVRDAPVELDLEACRFGTYDRRDVVDLFRELEFFRMVPRVPAALDGEARAEPKAAIRTVQPPASQEYKVVDTTARLEELMGELSDVGGFSFDTETTGTDPMKTDLVGFSFSTAPGRAWYVPVGHRDAVQLPLEEVLAKLRPVLESPEIAKYAHNGNFDLTVMANYGIDTRNLAFDTMIAAHLMGRKALALKNLSLDLLDIEMTRIGELLGTGAKQITMDRIPVERAAEYACSDADMTGRIRTILEEDIRKGGFWELFADVEMPLVPVLVTMQRQGVATDAGVLHEMSRDLHHQMQQLEATIYDLVGHAVNINSTQQLADVLFNELGLPKTKRTKTGHSTDANALEAIRGAHPVIDRILEYRQLSKLKSTYVDALPELINPRTSRIHTSYHQTGSATGRFSSSDPNLQNIPIRTELGRQVRRAFVAENSPEWTLFSADYSQIELRVLAHLSQDAGLLEAFQKGEDIHSATGSLMYDVPIDEVTADMRRIAKVLNFGVVYGLSAYGIAQQTEFSPEEGQKFIDVYFNKYPGIRQYIESTKEQGRNMGYVATPLGRRRYIPEMNSSNFNVRQAAERAAVNMPIQGGAADIMKLAMIRVQRRLEESAARARMLLQVHDELVFEVPVDEIEALRELVYQEMPSALELSVPLKVDVKTGDTWGDME